MKKNLFSIGISLTCFLFSATAAEVEKVSTDVPTHFIPAPNMDQIRAQDAEKDRKGLLYRVGVSSFLNLTNQSAGLWTTLANGDKKWQLIIKNPGAQALSFIFSRFKLSHGSEFFVQTKEGKLISEIVTKEDQLEDLQQHIALCAGDELVLTLIDKAYADVSEVIFDRVIYNYRSAGVFGLEKINESESCEVNVNCPEGDNYQDEKRGVARIYVVEGSGAGYCSGSLVNNLANDCKPYMLTALHCGPSVTTSVANMTLWKFYFNYEAPTCTNPTSAGTLASHFITGCVRIADSNDNDGTNISKSDFLFVQMGTLANETTTIGKLHGFSAYWNGWDANSTASPNGVGIHHPMGDIKKVSTYNNALTSTSWSGTPGTHWQVVWSATASSHAGTEPGSSGSPIFTYNGGSSRIVGTLSGGMSCCVANGCGGGGTSPTAPDLYGKVAYHWTSDGTANNQRLKPWLDPNNTGTMVMDGAYNPCNFVGLQEVKTDVTNIKLFPNPATDKLSVDLAGLSGKVTIEMYDMTGKLVATFVHNGGAKVDLDMTGITKGLYQVKIQSGDVISTQRISKI